MHRPFETCTVATGAGTGRQQRGPSMTYRGRLGIAVVAAVVAIATTVASQPVGADPAFAPLDRPGPALSVPLADLRAALHCNGNLAAGSLEPVLLNPATGVTPEQNYSW